MDIENSVEQNPGESSTPEPAQSQTPVSEIPQADQPVMPQVPAAQQPVEKAEEIHDDRAFGVEESIDEKPRKKKVAVKRKSEAVAAKGEDTDSMGAGGVKAWYVIHTLSGQENKVKENLESRLQSEEMGELITQVLIPTENVSEVKSGKKTVTTRKFFPGYVLVNMLLNEKTWYYIRDTSGVIGFVGTGKPVPLQDHEVAEIHSQIEEKKEKVKPKVMFDVGENVKVNDGPFVNFTGTVEDVNPDRGKLKVIVSIFGRATPIELEYWQVERS